MRICLLLLLLLPSVGYAESEVISHISNASVMVETQRGNGTGVAFRNGEYGFVWTAAHVVRTCQHIDQVVDPNTGQTKVDVWYDDVWLSQVVVKDGRTVGEVRRLAKIIRFSREHDLAVLQTYDAEWPSDSAEFDLSIPEVGQSILHIGNFKGASGAGSYSECIISAVGRLRAGFRHEQVRAPVIYDQFVGVAHTGSSGGGLFAENGKCIGLVTEFIYAEADGALCLAPARRMAEWAEEMDCEWAISDAPVDESQLGVRTDGTLKIVWSTPEAESPTPAPVPAPKPEIPDFLQYILPKKN